VSFTLKELAALCGGELRVIRRWKLTGRSLSEAVAGEITFYADPALSGAPSQTRASAIFVPLDFSGDHGRAPRGQPFEAY